MASLPSSPTTWMRYSKYILRESRKGVLYAVPVEGAAPIIYDPMENLNALSAAIAGGRQVHMGNRDEGVLLFAESAGLPGVLAEYAYRDYTVEKNDNYMPDGKFHKDVLVPQFFPFGAVNEHLCNSAKLTGRSGIYHIVFSPLYSEPVENIAELLESIYLDFISDAEPIACAPDGTSLRTMLRHLAAQAKAAHCLHICASCGKVYYDEDPDSEACSATCQNQADIAAERVWFNPEPVGGG